MVDVCDDILERKMSEELKTVERGEVTAEERTLGLVCVLLQFLVLIGPLILWLIKKDESAYLDALGRETINFQLTMLILYAVCGVLTVIVIGALLTPLVSLFNLVMIIVAAVKAYEGIIYRYPFCLRFLR